MGPPCLDDIRQVASSTALLMSSRVMHGVSVIFAFARVEERLSNYRDLRWVRHVEDREDRPLSVLNELIEGFRLEVVLDPIDSLHHPASAKDFRTGIGVHDAL